MNAVEFYPGIKWDYPPALSTVRPADLPDAFLQRLQISYRRQMELVDFGSSFWKQFAEKNADVDRILSSGDLRAVGNLAANPAATNMFWGFDATAADAVAPYFEDPEGLRASHVDAVCDRILRLAVATGAIRIEYPEASLDAPNLRDLDHALDAVATKTGALRFPNPFPHEIGVATSRGIVSYRPLQAIYQAFRLRELAQTFGGRVVEIGGGLGRTAYYARQFGIRDYTLIDIPISATAQAIFLAYTLGPDAITLPGEPHRNNTVRIETPAWFYVAQEAFDIALNADSMVEMDADHANRYVAVISKTCSCFLSINHEFNPFRVCDLPAAQELKVSRYPYWMRKGYAEELYEPGGMRRRVKSRLSRVKSRLKRIARPFS